MRVFVAFVIFITRPQRHKFRIVTWINQFKTWEQRNFLGTEKVSGVFVASEK